MSSNSLTVAAFDSALKDLVAQHVAGKRSLIDLARLTVRAVKEGTCPEDKRPEFARETYVKFAQLNNATKGAVETMETDAAKAKSSISKLNVFVIMGGTPQGSVDLIDHAVKAHKELVARGVKTMPTYENVVKAARAQNKENSKLKYKDVLKAITPVETVKKEGDNVASLKDIAARLRKHAETFIVNGAADTDGALRALDAVLAQYAASIVADAPANAVDAAIADLASAAPVAPAASVHAAA